VQHIRFTLVALELPDQINRVDSMVVAHQVETTATKVPVVEHLTLEILLVLD
jgi:hypothetical protein